MGFEPTLPFRVNTLSKRAPSATRPSLLMGLAAGSEAQNALTSALRFYGSQRENCNFTICRVGTQFKLSHYHLPESICQRISCPDSICQKMSAKTIYRKRKGALLLAADIKTSRSRCAADLVRYEGFVDVSALARASSGALPFPDEDDGAAGGAGDFVPSRTRLCRQNSASSRRSATPSLSYTLRR